MQQEITFGADPEFFIRNKSTKEYVPIIDKIGGTKEEPLLVHKGAFQEDGCAAEFNINPAKSKREFVSNINIVMEQLKETLDAQGLEFTYASEVFFKPYHLIDPRTKLSGCDPDYNVYTNKMNKYAPMEESNVRCAGGHIHIGSELLVNNPSARDNFIRFADFYIGAPMAALEQSKYRVDSYGMLGNYRPKEYGVEYRTPSNFWLQNDTLIEWVYDTLAFIHKAVARRNNKDYIATYTEKMRKYIANKNYVELRSLCQSLDIRLPGK